MLANNVNEPVLALGSQIEAPGKADVIHPLVSALERAEAHAQRLGEPFGLVGHGVKAAMMGRPQEQVVPVDGEPPKLVPLRAVK